MTDMRLIFGPWKGMIDMAMSLEDFLAQHPVDRKAVETEKKLALARVRAYRLREIRNATGLTQAAVAERIGVSQRQVSKIECGELDNSKISTVRSYVEAIGGELTLEVISGDSSVALA
ncbi:helix-turn-helix domain-containing protein [Corynebacterium sp. NPDC060344]|uniref:helix-turn-helix domain-containing protein n=1 Tax=Corynebacterium sp. NPDC060344 TaxID=3347101 RepID=UPI00364C8296